MPNIESGLDGNRHLSPRLARPRVSGFVLIALAGLALAACGGRADGAPPGVNGSGGPATESAASTAALAVASGIPGAAPSGETQTRGETGLPRPSTVPGPSGPSGPRATTPGLDPFRPLPVASRVVVRGLGIDLPVVSGDLQPPPNYPFCDVAAYLTTYRQPGQDGTTYITAHAQQGMFLPLLEASRDRNGAGLLDQRVDVYTDDAQDHVYRIFRVARHATDFSLADAVPAGEQWLILQTSEGPHGTVPKLVVAARLVETKTADPAEATPEAHPRDCRPPELAGTPSPAPTATVGVALPSPSGSPFVPPETPRPSAGGLGSAAHASRVVVSQLGIDLPVISSDLNPPPNYPLCDVAAYLTIFHQPAAAGTTYITAHAQPGMFLPLLDASNRADGAELLGMHVDVYTSDGQRYGYQIFQVQRHATDYELARDVAPGERRLILQTSEGPHGTVPKLVIAARLVERAPAGLSEANPTPRPRDCRPAELHASPAAP